jgi:hypothetical protein
MSYEASYKINSIKPTAIKEMKVDSLKYFEKYREGISKSIKVLNGLMRQQVTIPISFSEIKMNYEDNYRDILTSDKNMKLSCAKFEAISKNPMLNNLSMLTENNNFIGENSKEAKNINSSKIDDLVKNTFVEVEKACIDIQTAFILQAVNECKWNIKGSQKETNSQTLIAQKDDSILAIHITGNDFSIDFHGLSDNKCTEHADKLIKTLEKLGLQTKLIKQKRHLSHKGGALLSEGSDVKSVSGLAAKKKNTPHNKAFTIPVNISSNIQKKQINTQKNKINQ